MYDRDEYDEDSTPQYVQTYFPELTTLITKELEPPPYTLGLGTEYRVFHGDRVWNNGVVERYDKENGSCETGCWVQKNYIYRSNWYQVRVGGKYWNVPRLVATLFVPNPDPSYYKVVWFRDFNRHNWHHTNLLWQVTKNNPNFRLYWKEQKVDPYRFDGTFTVKQLEIGELYG